MSNNATPTEPAAEPTADTPARKPRWRPLKGLILSLTAFMFSLAVVGLIGIILASTVGRREEMRQRQVRIERDQAYSRLAYEYLGDQLGQRFEGKTLIILVRNWAKTPSDPGQLSDEIAHLEIGLADRMQTHVWNLAVVNNDLPVSHRFTTTTSVDQLQLALAAYVPGYQTVTADGTTVAPIHLGDPSDYVVLTISALPHQVNTLDLLSKPAAGRPQLVLMQENMYGLKQPMIDGVINFAIAQDPNFSWDSEYIPQAPADVLKERFLFIDQSNAETIAKEYYILN